MNIEIKTLIISKPNIFSECSNCIVIEPDIDNSFKGIGKEIQSRTNEKINKLLISTQCEIVDIIESDEVQTLSYRTIVRKNVANTTQTSNSINICPGLIARKENKK